MAIEIERKFLVKGTGWHHTVGVPFIQGYLNRDEKRTVRVRIAGNQSFLTIKGPSQGAARAEFEYQIPLAEAEQLLELCEGPVIQKIRRIIHHDGERWAVDEFLGENSGLVLAEVELNAEDQAFSRPEWLGQEVTHDSRYLNSSLSSRPYAKWHE